MNREDVLCLFPGRLKELLGSAGWDPRTLQEIRLRADRPVILSERDGDFFLAENGILTRHRTKAFCVSSREIRTVMEILARYSLYAYEEELGQGFLSIQGGHRAGVAGQVILDGNSVKGIRNISSVNIRFAHQITGCGDNVMPWIIKGNDVLNTLIISPPGWGKTTLLRDLIRQISDGNDFFQGCTVGVVDERSEIGGCFQGIPQNDLGIRTDILDGCPKSQGMIMLLRSMTPVVIAVDEIGTVEDARAVYRMIHSGCHILATVHGGSMEEIRKKTILKEFIEDGVFSRFVMVHKRKERDSAVSCSIYDEKGACLYTTLEKQQE